ncbi:MAG: quinolinate synthase NadA [Candidatus Zixiibacteriota bacterium]
MRLRDYAKLPKDELIERIKNAKKEKNILIIAHNYCRPEVQAIADYKGDSLGLSRIARDAKEPIILFAGVLFMAETAKILSPEKTILVPDIQGTCPLAADAAYSDVVKMKEKYPDAHFVTYVNSSAETKSLSDICCTSSNAVAVVKSLPEGKIVFLPDKNLGSYAREKSGRDIELWDGKCYVHAMISPSSIDKAKEKYPNATVMVHPECPPSVTEKADVIGSTGDMLKYARAHPDETIILGTEVGMVDRIKSEVPDIDIHPLEHSAVCANMKLNTLPKICRSVEELVYEVEVEEDIIKDAKQALEKMVSIG